jgi:hypothetical protein
MKYNKVYFLHIPKTGGRFLTKYILRPMEETLAKHGIEYLRMPEDMRQHGGWPFFIDDETYVVSLFREPSEFFVSTVCHAAAGRAELIDKENWHVIRGENLNVEKEELFSKLSYWHYMKDFQAHNFALSPDPAAMSVIKEAQFFHDEQKEYDEELIYDRINRTNLFIRTDELKNMDYTLLVKKISEDLGVELDVDLSEIDKTYFKNDASKRLFDSLTQSEKDLILENFTLDKKIYENDSLFWNPKTIL